MTKKQLFIALVAAGSIGSAGCKDLECAQGTVERNGQCQPSESMANGATCGPFTMLQGDKCVPMFPPTECDPSTTAPDVDPETGVTTCKGTGGGGCAAELPCPNPSSGKQTICGQIYDFENNQPFQTMATPMGTKCAAGSTDGPCALGITAYDALQFGANPNTAPALAVGDVYIDDCGRFRLTDITPPGGPFIGLGIDDAAMANRGPGGVTNAVGIAPPKAVNTALKGVEGYIVKKATTDSWASSGGPPLSGGIFAPVFRARSTGMMNQAGVTLLRGGSPDDANATYFPSGQSTRDSVDTNAMVTGANGTALVINAVASNGPIYTGSGALPPECMWTMHAGASLANIVFIEIIRPTSALGQTCNL